MGSGLCPDCMDAVGGHTNSGCDQSDCDCDHDYQAAAQRARNESMADVTFVRERGYERDGRCRHCGGQHTECDCNK